MNVMSVLLYIEIEGFLFFSYFPCFKNNLHCLDVYVTNYWTTLLIRTLWDSLYIDGLDQINLSLSLAIYIYITCIDMKRMPRDFFSCYHFNYFFYLWLFKRFCSWSNEFWVQIVYYWCVLYMVCIGYLCDWSYAN